MRSRSSWRGSGRPLRRSAVRCIGITRPSACGKRTAPCAEALTGDFPLALCGGQRLEAHHLIDHVAHAPRQRPAGIMQAELRHIRNIADMVAGTIAVVITPRYLAPGYRLDHLEAL